jgi:hypothetical protein
MPDKSKGREADHPWNVIYLLVAGALVLEITAFAILGWIYR